MQHKKDPKIDVSGNAWKKTMPLLVLLNIIVIGTLVLMNPAFAQGTPKPFITFIETSGDLSLYPYFGETLVQIFNSHEKLIDEVILVHVENKLVYTHVSVPEGTYKCVSPSGAIFGVIPGPPPAEEAVGMAGGSPEPGGTGGGGDLTVICTVWKGNPNLPHDTYSGKEITLQGTAKGFMQGTTYNYKWDFGDNSSSVTGAVTNPYAIEAKHIYTAAIGTSFAATLTVSAQTGGFVASDKYNVTVRDSTQDVKINIAISEGLWCLHKQMVRGTAEYVVGSPVEWGYFPILDNHMGSPYVGYVAAVTEAFEQQNHKAVGNPNEDPYVETVSRGLNWVLRQTYTWAIGLQHGENPDTNGNGIGLCTYSQSPSAPGDFIAYMYECPLALLALASSGIPADAIAPAVGRSNVDGQKYLDIMQDMADFIAWAQNDGDYGVPSGRGGWRYLANQENWRDSDNSNSQWPALALFAAEKNYPIVVPGWVKNETMNYWIPNSQDSGDGGFGYDWYGNWRNVGKTGAGLIELAWVGIKVGDDWRVTKAKDFIGNHWYDSGGANSDWNKGSYYAMYAVMKGARLSDPQITEFRSGVDWYNDYAVWLTANQQSDGSWPETWLDSWGDCGPILNTAWSISILLPTVFKPQPVAVLTAAPNPADIGTVITFDGSKSYDTNDPPLPIIRYEFNFGDGNTYVETSGSAPDGAFDGKTTHGYGAHNTYSATLKVFNGDSPPEASAPVSVTVRVIPPDHAPTAVIKVVSGAWKSNLPGIDYEAYSGALVTFSGGDSYDIDQKYGDMITKYEWDFSAPTDFNPSDATGVTASHKWITGSDTDQAFPLSLRVTDNGDASWVPPGPLQGSIPAQILIHPNAPPVAEAGPPQTSEQINLAGTPVTLDGSGSSDPNNDPLTYKWTWNGGSASGVNPVVTLPLGQTVITLVVNDGKVDSGPDTVTITVVDTTKPVITPTGVALVLWPPNGKYQTITISNCVASVKDICDAGVNLSGIAITSVSSDEPEDAKGVGDGNTLNDIVIVNSQTVQLRAEREGTGNGRVYTINYKVTDTSGNTATGSCKVSVPHDQNGAPAVDNGPGAGYTVYP